jgi:hypothetical protein
VDLAERRERRLVRYRRGPGLGAGEAGDEAGDDDDEPVGAGVDDACPGENVELLGRALDRVLADADGGPEDLDQHRVLGLLTDPAVELGALELVDLRRDGAVDVLDHGQHRSLARVADGAPRRLRRARKRVADEGRADQLTAARAQDLGRTAHDLAQDHARVAAGAHQSRVGDRLHDVVAVDGRERVRAQPVEPGEHRADRPGHVVAGVAVRDREDVQVVDLLLALPQVVVGNAHHAVEALDRWIRHRRG